MRQKTFSLVVGLIFLLIAVMHVLRLALKWEVVLNGWLVPMTPIERFALCRYNGIPLTWRVLRS